jgi:hypothetical protein
MGHRGPKNRTITGGCEKARKKAKTKQLRTFEVDNASDLEPTPVGGHKKGAGRKKRRDRIEDSDTQQVNLQSQEKKGRKR